MKILTALTLIALLTACGPQSPSITIINQPAPATSPSPQPTQSPTPSVSPSPSPSPSPTPDDSDPVTTCDKKCNHSRTILVVLDNDSHTYSCGCQK
jgi:hypothetical protein